jgi:hypothetical protein
MPRSRVLPGLLAAVVVLPLLAGCSALGIPDPATGADVLAGAAAGDPAATAAPAASPVQVSSHDGYTLTLPAGWVGTRTNGSTTQTVLDAITTSDALLGSEAGELFGSADASLSMVAADGSAVGTVPVPPVMAVLLIPSKGSADAQRRVDDVLATLPSITSEVQQTVASVRAGDAQRSDLTVTGVSLTVQLRVYLFTVGDDGIIFLFGSDPAIASAASADIDAIVKSLRFGV